MFAADFDYYRRGLGRRGRPAPGTASGCEAPRRRPQPDPAPQAPPGVAGRGDRHWTHRRAPGHHHRQRRAADRRADDACGARRVGRGPSARRGARRCGQPGWRPGGAQSRDHWRQHRARRPGLRSADRPRRARRDGGRRRCEWRTLDRRRRVLSGCDDDRARRARPAHAIDLPASANGQGTAYAKFPHPASRYAVIGVAASVPVGGGNITTAAVAIGGLVPAPVRCGAVEQALTGQAASADTIAAAAGAVTGDLGADDALLGDIFASAEYRKAVAPVYVRRALTAAVERAG